MTTAALRWFRCICVARFMMAAAVCNQWSKKNKTIDQFCFIGHRMFHALKFGEQSHQHPPMRSRGVDNRVIPLQAPTRSVHFDPTGAQNEVIRLQPPISFASGIVPSAVPTTQLSRRTSAMAQNNTVPSPVLLPSPTPYDCRPLPSRPPSASNFRQDSAVQTSRPSASNNSRTPAKIAPQAAERIRPLTIPSDADADKLFQRVDFNGNGMLSLAELDKAVIELWPELNHKPAIMRAYKAADRNDSGFISKTEFRLFLRFLAEYNNLFAKFQAADTSHDGRLTKQEFLKAAISIDELKRLDAAALFDKLDRNRGGVLLFDEFCEWFASEKALPPKRPTQPKGSLLKPLTTKKMQMPLTSSISDTFTRVDFNGNGMLSLAELDKAVVETWPEFNNKPALMRAYKAADRNKTGFLSKREFIAFLRYLVAYTNLFNTFCAMDASGDRRLTEEEFVIGCSLIDELKHLSEKERRAEFRRVDKNSGGVILFDEFAAEFAEQTLRSIPAVEESTASSTVVAQCPYCRRQRPVAHFDQCRATVVEDMLSLPACLRVPLPPCPQPAASDLAYFNSWSGDASQAIDEIYRCPECPKQFHPGQAKAFATHFLQHNLPPSRAPRIAKTRRDTTRFCYQPPRPVAPTLQSALPKSVHELLELEKAFQRLMMTGEKPTVRVLSVLFPKAKSFHQSIVDRCATWAECWEKMTLVSPRVSEAAKAQAHRILQFAESGLQAKIPRLFNFSVMNQGEELVQNLRGRAMQFAVIVRYLCLMRHAAKGDDVYEQFLGNAVH
jgi:Ca2+-binding EF-hand superfamily protein